MHSNSAPQPQHTFYPVSGPPYMVLLAPFRMTHAPFLPLYRPVSTDAFKKHKGTESTHVGTQRGRNTSTLYALGPTSPTLQLASLQ